jgi:transmembrane E3 ubiquitin-protein ligase
VIEEEPQTTCSFSVYGQIEPSHMSLRTMHELEAESQDPTGISVPVAPPMSIRGVLFSEDCGLLFTISNIDGTR